MQEEIFQNVQIETCNSSFPAEGTVSFSYWLSDAELSLHSPSQQGQHPGNNVMGAGRPKPALLCC